MKEFEVCNNNIEKYIRKRPEIKINNNILNYYCIQYDNNIQKELNMKYHIHRLYSIQKILNEIIKKKNY